MSTVRRRLAEHSVSDRQATPRAVMLLLDTTYFKRDFGITVIRDWYEKENLKIEEVDYENLKTYKRGVEELQKQGFRVQGIVVDGRKGLLTAFPGIPVQLCQFHQIKTVIRYITAHPKLQAGKELLSITQKLTVVDRKTFTLLLDTWYVMWGEFMAEKSVNPETGRKNYTHKRLRSAYFSLNRNLPFLFTYKDFPALNMPNTLNSIEATFKCLKARLKVHSGLRRDRKIRLVRELL